MCQMMGAMEQYYIESNTQQSNTPDIDTPDLNTPDVDAPDVDAPGPIRIRSYRDNYIIHLSKSRALDIGDAVQALNLIAKRKCFDAIKSELKNKHGCLLKSNINQNQGCRYRQKLYKDAWYQKNKCEIREKLNNKYATDPELYKRTREIAKQSYRRCRANIEPKQRWRPKQVVADNIEQKSPKQRGRPKQYKKLK